MENRGNEGHLLHIAGFLLDDGGQGHPLVEGQVSFGGGLFHFLGQPGVELPHHGFQQPLYGEVLRDGVGGGEEIPFQAGHVHPQFSDKGGLLH